MMNGAQNYSPEVVLKNTALAVIVPLKDGVSSLNKVYEALIKADVDPVTGQCSNYDYVRLQIVQAHQYLQRSEQTASSGLKSLDENLERLIQDKGKLEQEMNDTKQTLDNLRAKQASNEYLLRESQGAMKQAKGNLNSTMQTLNEQQTRKQNAEIVTGVGAGLFVIPVFGWIAGTAMLVGGAIELDKAKHAVSVAEDEVRRSENNVEIYKQEICDYESMISRIKNDIGHKGEKLKQTREVIQNVRKQIEAVGEFQKKVRSAVQLLGVLTRRASVAEHQTRRFILQEPVMKVMKDVMKATKEITGNEILYNEDMLTLINKMKKNNHRLEAICASENTTENYY